MIGIELMDAIHNHTGDFVFHRDELFTDDFYTFTTSHQFIVFEILLSGLYTVDNWYKTPNKLVIEISAGDNWIKLPTD